MIELPEFEVDWWRHRLRWYAAIYRGIDIVDGPFRFWTRRGASRWAHARSYELQRDEHRRLTYAAARRAAA